MRYRIFGYLTAFCCAAVALATKPSSPATGSDLICHTTDPSECYPRIFQPTEDFQIVHDDQELPPGLHVRLNIYTGLREARLNIPVDGDDMEAEQAVVIVPEEDTISEIVDEQQSAQTSDPRKPPPYDAAGKISPPRDAEASGDSEQFHRAVDILSEKTPPQDEDLDLALSDLFELSHDIFYGVELMKQHDVLQNLVSLLAEEGFVKNPIPKQRRQAASILTNSIQNNPTALKEFQKSWKEVIAAKCKSGFDAESGECETGALVDTVLGALKSEREPSAMKAKIGALSGLAKDNGIRDNFLAKKGMELLLTIFPRDGEEWDGTRIKIAQFIMDTFLDENMGADLGVWPTQPAADSKICAQKDKSVDEGCWEYHLENLKGHTSDGDDSWREDFLRLLRQSSGRQRKTAERSPDREL